MTDRSKKVHGALFLTFLITFALQTTVPLFPNGSLTGAVDSNQPVELSVENVINGSYTNYINTLCIERLGFKAHLARTHNQINYSLFNYVRPTNSNLINGIEGWLYEGYYLYDKIKPNWMTDSDIQSFATDFKQIQDYFHSRQAEIFIIIAPTKISVYPEYTPTHFQTRFEKNKPHLDYPKLAPVLTANNINLIDGVKWFSQRKEENPDYLLFSRAGTHWGEFAAFEFLQYAIQQINTSPYVELADLEASGKTTQLSRGYDNDIAIMLNILDQNAPKDMMPYPTLIKHDLDSTQSPKTKIFGDSFSWIFNRYLVESNILPSLDMQYSNVCDIEYRNGSETRTPIKPLDLDQLAQPGQLVLIVYNEAFVHNRFTGFIDKALQQIQTPSDKN